MKFELITIAFICFLMFTATVIFTSSSSETKEEQEEVDLMVEHQGPVPLGYDLEHFRETGETILEASK